MAPDIAASVAFLGSPVDPLLAALAGDG